MTTPVGGRRARLIRDSFYWYVHDGVVLRGWMNTGRKHTPFQFIPAPNNWDEEVPPNSIAVSAEDVFDDEAELGSLMTDDTWTYYVDIYGEHEKEAMDCAYDVRDLLRGKIPTLGYSNPAFPVNNYSEATPSVMFYCQVENVIVDRARNFPQAWRRFWFSVRCDVIDSYATELDT